MKKNILDTFYLKFIKQHTENLLIIIFICIRVHARTLLEGLKIIFIFLLKSCLLKYNAYICNVINK